MTGRRAKITLIEFDNWTNGPADLGGWDDISGGHGRVIVEIGPRDGVSAPRTTSSATDTIAADDVALVGDSSAQTLNGGSLDDFIHGAGGNDTLAGNAGDDVLGGGDGDDIISGGDGIDRIFGEGGSDTLDGGAGDDIIKDDSGSNVITGGAGQDWIRSGAGNDTINSDDDERDWIYGEAGSDLIIGDTMDVSRYRVIDESGPLSFDDFNKTSLAVGQDASGFDKVTDATGLIDIAWFDASGDLKVRDLNSAFSFDADGHRIYTLSRAPSQTL